MRFKYYIRGFGLGLLLATIVLTIAYHTNGKLSDDEIKARAAKLGMVDPTDTENDTEESGLSEASENASDLEDEDSAAGDTEALENTNTEDSNAEDSNGDSTAETGDSTNDANTSESSEATGTAEAEYYTVVIESGNTTRHVGNQLVTYGLASSAEEFMKYMTQNGWDDFLQPGTYQIPTDASFHDVAVIVTNGRVQ